MSRDDLLTEILKQPTSRTRLADTRALMQRVQALAEREWERERQLLCDPEPPPAGD